MAMGEDRWTSLVREVVEALHATEGPELTIEVKDMSHAWMVTASKTEDAPHAIRVSIEVSDPTEDHPTPHLEVLYDGEVIATTESPSIAAQQVRKTINSIRVVSAQLAYRRAAEAKKNQGKT